MAPEVKPPISENRRKPSKTQEMVAEELCFSIDVFLYKIIRISVRACDCILIILIEG